MKTTLLGIILVALFWQSTSAAELTMRHRIIVPEEYVYGRNQEAFEGTSDIERYINAFEKTWWAVMNRFAQDISVPPRHDDFVCSGTPAAAQGCIDGYEGAIKKVEGFLRGHKKSEVHKFIKESIGK